MPIFPCQYKYMEKNENSGKGLEATYLIPVEKEETMGQEVAS